MFNVNLVTAKMKLQVESQDGSVLVAQVPVVTTLGAGPTALRHQPDNQETRTGVDIFLQNAGEVGVRKRMCFKANSEEDLYRKTDQNSAKS